ncbi:MAG: hypothetical protein R2941_02445 [Desulfobacterales bacterium]
MNRKNAAIFRECPLWPVFAALAGLLFSGCIIPDTYLHQGRQYMAEEDWDRSAHFYEQALKKYPDNTEVRLMLKSAKWQASQSHQIRGEVLLSNGQHNEAIAQFQFSLLMDPSNRKAAELIETAKKKKNADRCIRQSQNYLKTRQFRQAREMLDKALSLDPENEKARNLLSFFEKKEENQPAFRLKVKNDAPISLKFRNTPVINVFEVLSSLSGVNFIFDRDMKESSVTLFMTDVSFDRFLEVLLAANDLQGRAVDEKTMLIYPDRPEKAKEYQELQIRTFYLANADAKSLAGMLSGMLKIRSIFPNEKLNAIVLRAPEKMMDIASRVIAANDRPAPEVLLNVEILEVSRSREKQFGIELNPASMTVGIGKTSSEIQTDSSFANMASLEALSGISKQEIMLSVPTATLNFLKQDGDTRILASPRIRVNSGKKSKILIGERIPLRTNRRIDTTGVVTFDYQYQEIGVRLEAMPVINLHGEITLDMRLEVSAMGPNIGTGDDPQYSIRTRTAQSILTIFDGETVIIGGLISDEERETLRKVPFIEQIPILGRIFSNENREDARTDILMAITPVITRAQEMPDPDAVQVWSGSEERFSTSEPYESMAEREERYADRPAKPIPAEELEDTEEETLILQRMELP